MFNLPEHSKQANFIYIALFFQTNECSSKCFFGTKMKTKYKIQVKYKKKKKKL